MLLVSGITPSACEWALESGRAQEPSANHLLLSGVDASSTQALVSEVFGVFGAQKTSVELLGSLASFRDVFALLAAWESDASRRFIVECARPPGEIAAEVTSLRLLLEAAGSAPSARELAVRLLALEQAFGSGEIEWVVGCPPQVDAIEELTSQVAVAAGAGVWIRGVVIAPMPRKGDGWPKSIRSAAKQLAEHASIRLHPVPIQRMRAGKAPRFDSVAVDGVEVATIRQATGEHLFTISVPGLGEACRAVGTWSADPAYPVTHVLLDVAGTVVRRPVDATLRRCNAVDAVLAGDTVTVTFVPHEGQWPANDQGEA